MSAARGLARIGWPRSMAGQLLALLLLGLLAGYFASQQVLRLPRAGDVPHPVSRDHLFDQFVHTYRAAQTVPGSDLPGLLQSQATPHARFWVTPPGQTPPHTPEGRRQRALRELLAQRLPSLEPAQLRITVERPAQRVDGRPTIRIATAAQLPDGRWLHGEQTAHAGQRPWWWGSHVTLPVIALIVAAIVFAFVRRALRPLQALARAAEQVSRGERIAPLPLAGPREAREVSAAFNRMQERIDRFMSDRTQMLAAISHDLRTPITALRLRAELVEDPTLRAPMVRILDDMRTMVEQILGFTRDETASEATQAIDLQALLAELAGEFRALGHDVALAAHPPLPCRARPVALKRAVGNLLDNAARHGRHVRVRLHAEPSHALIDIDDDGPGIAPELLEQVFEPFHQGDHARQAGGTGLGLPIARSCVHAHGGSVTLHNLPEGGLRARIALPT